jgi:predicted RNase H-like HicB family nuclease
MKKLKKLIIVIERSADLFSAYAANAPGIYGGGNTVAEAKQSILDAVRLFKENNEPENIPAILKSEYEIEYKLDVESFFNYFNGIFTKSGIEKLTGINQKQLGHYSSGTKKPRPRQRLKIQTALHQLGNELLMVKL